MGALLVVFLPQVLSVLDHLFSWVKKEGGLGIFYFALLITVGCIALIPLTLFGVGAALTFQSMFGSVNGFFLSLTVVFFAYYGGSLLAFLLGRSLCRRCSR